jgi:hypothetical protein
VTAKPAWNRATKYRKKDLSFESDPANPHSGLKPHTIAKFVYAADNMVFNTPPAQWEYYVEGKGWEDISLISGPRFLPDTVYRKKDKSFTSYPMPDETETHIHAEAMKKFAEDAAICKEPWELWECRRGSSPWGVCTSMPIWLEEVSYRRKDKLFISYGKGTFVQVDNSQGIQPAKGEGDETEKQGTPSARALSNMEKQARLAEFCAETYMNDMANLAKKLNLKMEVLHDSIILESRDETHVTEATSDPTGPVELTALTTHEALRAMGCKVYSESDPGTWEDQHGINRQTEMYLAASVIDVPSITPKQLYKKWIALPFVSVSIPFEKLQPKDRKKWALRCAIAKALL